ncbi:hypothetical protein BH18CHL2_BH18CHL2_07170 [soil metagenome]
MTDLRALAAPLVILLVGAACVTRADLPVPAAPRAEEPATATYEPPASAGAARSIPRPEGPPRAVLVDDDGSGQRLRARPIDPSTLADIPGYEPIPFGHHFVARVSPDGRTIAAVIWPGGSTDGPMALHLIDVRSWTARAVGVPLTGHTSAIRFERSGSGLYWAQSAPGESAESLYRLDLGSGHVREITDLPRGFAVRALETLETGVALYLSPSQIARAGDPPPEAPRIVVVDTASGQVTAAVPLSGIRSGQFQEAPADGTEQPFRLVDPGLAWDLARDRLYVADAESDRIFMVDLRSGELRGPFVPRPRRSLMDAVWSLFGSVAEAKIASTTQQHAAISPDGRVLYVSGLRSNFSKGADGKYHEVVTPMDLRIMDTEDMSEAARLPGATSPLWLSPDGTALLYASNRYDSSAEGYAARVDHKLHLLRASPPYGVTTAPLAAEPWLVAFETGSAYVVVTPQQRASLLRFDVGTGELIAAREMDRHFADVLPLR